MQLKDDSYLQNGKYRVVRVLGQGGFGITYLAKNLLLDKTVAIKEFYPKDFYNRDYDGHLRLATHNNLETASKLKARFIKEAQYIARLNHNGIIKIHDIFEENSTAYYVMDYIEGENLNEKIKRNGPLSERQALKYIKQVGLALQYIHDQKMTHYDVKPANIVIRNSDDTPILIDFGLSRQYDSQGEATSTLMQGVSSGYSPIELYNPGSISSLSPQTDVYSLGATLYYTLTGVVPPAASVISENGLNLPIRLSPKIASAIRSAMEVSRANRPKDIRTFVEALSCQTPSNYKKEFSASVQCEETMVIGSKPENAKNPIPEPGTNTSTNPSPTKKWWFIGMFFLAILLVILVHNGNITTQNKVAIDTPMSKTESTIDSKSTTPTPSNSGKVDNTSTSKSSSKGTPPATTLNHVPQSEVKKNNKKSNSSSLSTAVSPSAAESQKTRSTGKYNYSYGTYNGELRNGKPHGEGKLTFSSPHSDNRYGYSAEIGDYIEGYFTNGILDPGATLIKTNGSRQKLY